MKKTISKKSAIFLLVFFLLQTALYAQRAEKKSKSNPLFAGAELLWYPAGFITGATAGYYVAPKHFISAGIGIDIANRKDFGKNDDEKGTGFGGSLGYRYVFTPNKSSFFLGARVDLWTMKVNWKDKVGTPQAINGTTKITIFQPTATVGYWVKPKNSRFNFLFSAGGGAEINIKTNGKDVGEGGMWLVGTVIYYSL